MSFGWSAGDIAFTISLLISAAKALDDVNGAAGDFRDIRKSITAEKRYLLSSIKSKKPVEDFLDLIQKFKKSLGNVNAKAAHRNVVRKLQWKYMYSENAKKLQERIERHLLVLSPLMHRLTMEAIEVSREKVSQQLREDIMDLLDSSLERGLMNGPRQSNAAAWAADLDIKADAPEPKSLREIELEKEKQLEIEPKSLMTIEPKSRDIEKRVVMTLNARSRQPAPTPTQVIRTPNGNAEHHLQAMYAQIDRVVTEVPSPLLRYGVRTELERAAGRMMADIQQSDTSSDGINTPCSSTSESSSVTGSTCEEVQLWKHSGKIRRKVLARTSSKISTVLGSFHFTVQELECFRNTIFNGSAVGVSREFESSFQLVPSWWLIKCRLSSSIGAQIIKTTEGALTFKFQTFNVIPDDSLIFDFATHGNVGGIQTLLSRGLASVNDVDSLGRTPLHYAADSCRPEACQILLEQGADMMKKDLDVWNFTPFKRACYPSSLSGTKRSPDDCESFSSQVLQHRIDAMRVFLTAGLDIEDEVENQSMRVAGFHERKLVRQSIPFPSATFWILNQFISTAKQNTYVYGSEWWAHKLYEALGSDPGGPTMQEVVKCCDRTANQRTLLIWIDIQDHIRQEIELHPNDWTEETLLVLFEDDFHPEYENHKALVCVACHCSALITHEREPAWEQRVSRIKQSKSVESPLSKDEIQDLNKWNEMVRHSVEDSICFRCQFLAKRAGEEEADSPFLLEI